MEEVRLDLLFTSENGQADTGIQEGAIRMPEQDASLRQEGKAQIEQLMAEEEKLRALVADLTSQVGLPNDKGRARLRLWQRWKHSIDL